MLSYVWLASIIGIILFGIIVDNISYEDWSFNGLILSIFTFIGSSILAIFYLIKFVTK
jgi:hypothetical protein